ncbi:MAG: sugar kinase [Rhodobacteraceae bacterium]|jgi:2-dehydro-3-deoxygluconokinase|nr:sugar kinase [Paracoccaceae bacterium]
MTRILCIGEAMAEIRREGAGFAVGFAGDTFNTAVYCRRRLKRGSVGYQTRIGTDPFSGAFMNLANAERLDLSAIRSDPAHNIGIYSVQTDAADERSFACWRSMSAARSLFQRAEDFAAPTNADILYLSGITLAILTPAARAALMTSLAELRVAGRRVAFDSNDRPQLRCDAGTARQAIAEAWALTDIALPSVDDEMALFGDANAAQVLERLRGLGVVAGALKCGALAMEPGVAPQTFPRANRVVDTTATGDSFNGGFLAAWAEGADTSQAMLVGHDLARMGGPPSDRRAGAGGGPIRIPGPPRSREPWR